MGDLKRMGTFRMVEIWSHSIREEMSPVFASPNLQFSAHRRAVCACVNWKIGPLCISSKYYVLSLWLPGLKPKVPLCVTEEGMGSGNRTLDLTLVLPLCLP